MAKDDSKASRRESASHAGGQQGRARGRAESAGAATEGAPTSGDSPRASDAERGLRGRLSSEAEERIGTILEELVENPVINSALQRVFGARERMAQAQETAMEALNLPSASNLEKLARRLRSVSQRLEAIEDGVEKLDQRVGALSSTGDAKPDYKLGEHLKRIDSRLEELATDVADLRRQLSAAGASVQPATVPDA